jgi:hypothetical protein
LTLATCSAGTALVKLGRLMIPFGDLCDTPLPASA